VPRPWERYGWVDESWLAEAGFCVSVATNGEVAAVRGTFGADPAPETLADISEAWNLSLDDEAGNDVVQVGLLDGCVVVLEPNGYTGIDVDVAASASRGGRYVSYYCSVNADMLVVYAVDGVVVRAFDPLLYDPDIDPGEPLPEEAGLPFGE